MRSKRKLDSSLIISSRSSKRVSIQDSSNTVIGHHHAAKAIAENSRRVGLIEYGMARAVVTNKSVEHRIPQIAVPGLQDRLNSEAARYPCLKRRTDIEQRRMVGTRSTIGQARKRRHRSNGTWGMILSGPGSSQSRSLGFLSIDDSSRKPITQFD